MDQALSNVFILGAPRSGTSALAWAMAEHPKLWTTAETNILFYLLRDPWIREQYDVVSGTKAEGTWLAKHNISYEEFASYLGKGFDLLCRSRSGGRIWVDSTPAYTMIIPQLMVYFPDAKFIHIIRQGRAVVNSMLKSGFDYAAFKDFKMACQTWVLYVERGRQAEQDYFGRVLEVRHEALTSQPEQVFDRIYGFLGLEPCAESAAFIRTKQVNSSYLNVRKEDVHDKIKDPTTMPVEPWREWNDQQRRLFQKVCGEMMHDLGYDLETASKG